MLFNATRDFNDRRIIDALAGVARRSGVAEETRVYAFALLYSYAVPGIYIEIEDLLDSEEEYPALGASSPDERTYRTLELLGDLRPEVGRLLRSVMEAEPDSRVGDAARTILEVLENSI